MEAVEVVVAHRERATVRIGDVFLKIDAHQERTDVEVEAMALAPIPTPAVLWRKPPVLALSALPGTPLAGSVSHRPRQRWRCRGRSRRTEPARRAPAVMARRSAG